MNTKLNSSAIALIAICGTMAFAGIAGARGQAPTTVTINAGGEVDGTVSSPEAKKCAGHRLIKVFKVKNGPNKLIGSDEASKEHGGVADWSIGNPGVGGKIYAKAPATEDCEKGRSPAVEA